MPANLENSAVATGQEKVSFHFNIWQNQYNIVKFKNKMKFKKIITGKINKQNFGDFKKKKKTIPMENKCK